MIQANPWFAPLGKKLRRPLSVQKFADELAHDLIETSESVTNAWVMSHGGAALTQTYSERWTGQRDVEERSTEVGLELIPPRK